MYFLYRDESGNTGSDLTSLEQPVHWLVSIGDSPQSVRSIEQGMSAQSLRYFRARARLPKFEFHGSHLFQGRGECRDLTPPQRVALYREIVSLIGWHHGRLFIRGIDKAAHAKRAKERSYRPEHPHKLATSSSGLTSGWRPVNESGWREENWTRSEKAVVRLWRENCQPHVETERVWPQQKARSGRTQLAGARQGKPTPFRPGPAEPHHSSSGGPIALAPAVRQSSHQMYPRLWRKAIIAFRLPSDMF